MKIRMLIGLLALTCAAAEEREPAKWTGLDELFVPALNSITQKALLKQQRVCFLHLHRRPNDMENLATIAEVQLKLGRPALAADYAQRLIQRDPTQRRAFRIFIQALYFSGRHGLATALNKQAIQLGFDDPLNRLLMAEMHIRSGKPDLASVELVRVIGELDEAQTGLKTSELQRIKLHCLRNQAELYRHLGRDEEREACLELIESINAN